MARDPHIRQSARITLSAFLLTFLAARIIVLLIMTRRIPDLFLHLGGTHVHHLNYGIFLLSGIGAYLVFAQPHSGHLRVAAAVYGVGLGLTFDEFGMWLHLGGGYWQRASFDAVVLIAAILALIAFAPHPGHWRRRHWIVLGVLLVATVVFGGLIRESLARAEDMLVPRLQGLEANSPV